MMRRWRSFGSPSPFLTKSSATLMHVLMFATRIKPQENFLFSARSMRLFSCSGLIALAKLSSQHFSLLPVAKAVEDIFREGVWVRVEVLRADVRSGHVYLELAERDETGKVRAQARAVIWSSVASRIVAQFEQATGVVLGEGIKLLVRATPKVHSLYGLSLVIDAIDPQFTLGDLEAKKREIRERLKREGLFDRNRKLPPPWDFNHVLVAAPQAAAGLGDFQAESNRLQVSGVCCFHYTFARFQGEGAPAEIRQALMRGMQMFRQRHDEDLDAVVIIRGGGAVNDLAWLNDYDLARMICEMPAPVFTGIGHERDNTILDEVAHTRFDTPSKVILGIESVIRDRTQEAKQAYSEVLYWCEQAVQKTGAQICSLRDTVALEANASLDRARQASADTMGDIRILAVQSLKDTAAAVAQAHTGVLHAGASHIERARSNAEALYGAVLERSTRDAMAAKDSVSRTMKDIAAGAHAAVESAKAASEALMREIAGQGPEKTLRRGFALVRDHQGLPITSAQQAVQADSMEIEFHDGRVPSLLCQPADGHFEGESNRG